MPRDTTWRSSTRVSECTDNKLALDLMTLDANGGKCFDVDTDQLRANSYLNSWISSMIEDARFFDQKEYAETLGEFDMARDHQRFVPWPIDATHHIQLIDDNWEKSFFNDKIAKIKKWVQVMVFDHDESESDEELGNEDGMAPARSRPCSAACPFGVLCSWPSAGEPGPVRRGTWGMPGGPGGCTSDFVSPLPRILLTTDEQK